MENINQSEKKDRTYYQQQAIERVGETKLNNVGGIMLIDQYNNSQDIIVKFLKTGSKVKTTYQNFINGAVKDPYDNSVFGVGYIGVGKYKAKVNGVMTIQYQAWKNMLLRCYSEEFQKAHPTYQGCIVADEWLNFQNFAKWYDENYYEIEGHRVELDKDLLSGDNKIYSPETCVYAPKIINTLFLKMDANRGALPIGVRQSGKKFQARCRIGAGNPVMLGSHVTEEEAFNAYKKFKENHIKEVAEQYKGLIPDKLYTAMLKYEVKITD